MGYQKYTKNHRTQPRIPLGRLELKVLPRTLAVDRGAQCHTTRTHSIDPRRRTQEGLASYGQGETGAPWRERMREKHTTTELIRLVTTMSTSITDDINADALTTITLVLAIGQACRPNDHAYTHTHTHT